MSEEKEVFWNYLSILIGQAGTTGLMLLITIITARVLQPEGFGIFSLFLMIAGLLSVLCIDWPNSSIIRFGKEEFLKTGSLAEVFWGRIIIFASCFGIITLFLFVAREWIAGYIGINQNIVFFILAYVFLVSVFEIQLYILQAVGMFKEFGLVPFIGKLSNLLLLFFVVFIIGLTDILFIIGISIITQLISVLVIVTTLRREWFTPPKFSQRKITEMVQFSWPMIFGAVSVVIIGYIDTIIIKEFLPISSVGIYSIAYLGMTSVSVVILSIVSLLFPLITTFRYQGRVVLIRQYMDEIIPQGVFIWSVFISALMVIGSIVIPLLFGISYSTAVIPFVILLAGLSARSVSSFYSGITVSFDLMKKVVILSVLIAVLNIIGDLLLIPIWGINGAAVATALSFIIVNIIYVPFVNGPLIKKCSVLESKYPRAFCLVYNFPAFPALLICIFIDSAVLQILLFILLLSLSLAIAIKTGLFKEGTIDIIKYINMPDCIKIPIIRAYRLLI